MKKIALSVFSMVVVAGLLVGAVSSYFTNKKEVEGMQVVNGILEISDASPDWSRTVSFKNLKPGDRVRKWVTFKNTGTLDVDTLTVNAENVSDPDGLLSKLVVSVVGVVDGGEAAYFTSDWSPVKPTVASWFNNADILDVSYYRQAAGIIKPGQSYTLSFDFIVPQDLGNEWQSRGASFDMAFTAGQVR